MENAVEAIAAMERAVEAIAATDIVVMMDVETAIIAAVVADAINATKGFFTKR